MDTIHNRIQNINQRKEEFRQVFQWSPIALKGQIIHSWVITTIFTIQRNAKYLKTIFQDYADELKNYKLNNW